VKAYCLGELVNIVGGGTPSRKVADYWGGAIPWATVKDFKTEVLSKTLECITQTGVKNSATNIIPAGNIIVPTRMALGKAAINLVDLAINQDLKALIIRDKSLVDREYLLRSLLSKSSFIESQGNGATVKGITIDVLKDLELELPPLAEQRRIAAILDKADAIRRKRQRAIELTEDFLRSAFLEMFGDPVTNPRGWLLSKFGKIGELDRGKSKHRPRNAPELLGGPYPLIQTGDVANSDGYIKNYYSTYSEIGLKQSRMWPKGTLCITIAANIAKTGILAFDSCFPDSVVGFTPNKKTNTEYVQHWMSFLQKILEETAPESAQKNINLKILRELDVPLPPKEQQEAFSRLVKKTEATKEKLNTALQKENCLFNSLTHLAFRGELTSETADKILQ
jgi:type I restriction enzyme S subunit